MMTDPYQVKTTSHATAQVSDVWLDKPEDPETAQTRRVLRVTLVDNIHSTDARVKATMIHQRRHKKGDPWQDIASFNQATLKAGEEVRMALGASETLDLFRELERWFNQTRDGIPHVDQRLVLMPEDETIMVRGPVKGVIEKLLNESQAEVLQAIGEIQPDLLRAMGLTRLHREREECVAEFERHLAADDWEEGEWQRFFEQNTWIFGYGLDYRFLSVVESQPDYGGQTIGGTGSQRGDFLMSTEAEERFTVLVEIKKPSCTLVSDTPYRNKAHLLGRELVGGVTQLQSNCRTWDRDGARQDENREILAEVGAHTIQPKGILVIGNSSKLDSVTKRTTFELFRYHTLNPDIITFDELLERSKRILLKYESQRCDPPPPQQS